MTITHVTSLYANATSLSILDLHDTNITGDFDPNVELLSTPVWLVILMAAISTWTLVANGLIFVCLITSRSAMKNNVNVQLLSLSFSDMLVGINTMPVLMLLAESQLSTYESCAAVIYMYLVSQAATLGHALLICINRLVTITKTSGVNQSKNESLKTIFVQIVAIWAGCLMYFGIHFLAFARFGDTLNRCSTYHLFRNKFYAEALLSSPLFVPALLCTNVIYGYLLIHIRRRLRVVGIVHVKPKASPDIVKFKTCLEPNKPSNTADRQTSNLLTTSLESEQPKGPEGSVDHAQTKVIFIIDEQEPGTSNSCKADCNANDGKETKKEFAPGTELKGEACTNQCSTTRVTEPNTHDIVPIKMANSKTSRPIVEPGNPRKTNGRLGLERQRRVLVTFGILLVSLNIFMTPLSFLPIIEMILNRPMPRSVRFVFMMLAMLNSALNPVINMWRIKPFWAIMKGRALKIYEALRFW